MDKVPLPLPFNEWGNLEMGIPEVLTDSWNYECSDSILEEILTKYRGAWKKLANE